MDCGGEYQLRRVFVDDCEGFVRWKMARIVQGGKVWARFKDALTEWQARGKGLACEFWERVTTSL
jgi:hypothetical protein